MPVTGDTEKDDAAEAQIVLKELTGVDKAFRSVEKIQNNGYWLNLVFVTADQRDEFVRKLGLDHCSEDGTYYDGLQAAEALGVSLTPERVAFRRRKPDVRLVEDVGIIPEED